MGIFFNKSKSFFQRETSLDLFLKDINRYPVLDKATEDLAALSHDVKKLVNSNLRFAVRAAHSFAYRGDILDLIQCASEGLMKAAELYDPTRMVANGRFIHYAKDFIFAELQRYVRTQNTTYSRDNYYLAGRINKISSAYLAMYGEEPGYEYLAEHLGVTPEKVEEVMFGNHEFVSENDQFGGEDQTYLDYMYGDLDADADSFNSDRRVAVEQAMHLLSKNEEKVIRAFFGIGCRQMSITDIADMLHLTPQRCNQLKKSAITKLNTCGELREMF